VAHLRLPEGFASLLDGSWRLYVPIEKKKTFSITVKSIGQSNLVPSWRNRLGLPDFKDERWFDKVEVSTEDAMGDYVRVNCTACFAPRADRWSFSSTILFLGRIRS
jgi:hypothetical protein